MASKTVKVGSTVGLHARPATVIADAAGEYDDEILLTLVGGDEDDGVLETDLMLKRTIPRAGLAVLPRSGHLTNLEEPALFNALVEDFLARVDAGRWGPRDPRSLSTSTTGATT